MHSPRKMKTSGSSTLSAQRAKRNRAREDESSDSSEQDVDKAIKKVKEREETEVLARTARDRERENAALRERIRKADDERILLNKQMRESHNGFPDDDREQFAPVRTPPTSAKVKVRLNSPNRELFCARATMHFWIY